MILWFFFINFIRVLRLRVNIDNVVLYVKLNDAAFDLSNGPVVDEVFSLFC